MKITRLPEASGNVDDYLQHELRGHWLLDGGHWRSHLKYQMIMMIYLLPVIKLPDYHHHLFCRFLLCD